MAHKDLAQQTFAEQNMLNLLIQGLRGTLAWKVQGTDFTRKLSTVRFIAKSFQRHLERVLEIEEKGGYMDLVLQANPQQGDTVSALRKEHQQFREDSNRIVHELEHVPPTDGDSFSRVCGELDDLLNRLDTHNKKEINLVQVAFDQDEGGEG